jgi:hypothetical protein
VDDKKNIYNHILTYQTHPLNELHLLHAPARTFDRGQRAGGNDLVFFHDAVGQYDASAQAATGSSSPALIRSRIFSA